MSLLLLREDGARLFFDAILSTDLDLAIRVTEHPIEQGAAASDHAQRQARRFRIRALLTETPRAGALGPTGPDRIASAAAWLEASVGQFIAVSGDVRVGVREGCLLEAAPYRLEQARRAFFDLQFVQPRQVQAQTVDLPARLLSPERLVEQDPTVDAAQQEAAERLMAMNASAVDAGTQPTRSLAASAFDAAVDLPTLFGGGS